MKERWKSLQETHRQGLRLLKVIHQMDRNMLPGTILECILKAAIPYISIVLSAQMIDELLAKQYQNGMIVAVCMVVGILVAELMRTMLSYQNDVARNLLQIKLEIGIRKKGMELDYQTMGDTEVLQAITNAESATMYNGGLASVVNRYADILQNGLSIAAAVFFAVEFCVRQGNSLIIQEKGVLGIVAKPVVTMLILWMAWLIGMKLSRTQAQEMQILEDEISKKHYEAENQIGYWLIGVLADVTAGKTIRVNGMSKLIIHNAKKWTDKCRPLYENMGLAEQKKVMVEGIESGCFSVAVYFLVLVKVLVQAISIGSFTKYTGALLQFNQACSKIVWSENEIRRLVQMMSPFADFLERENQMETGSIHIEKRLDNCYEIEFHDVGFQYPGSEEFVLRHVNAKITLKNKLAVVGKNGAGKSTFIKLLCRLYDPTEGVITLNGVDIRKYKYEEYLKLFGVVFQDFHLFGYPIAQNIAVHPIYDKERVHKCLEQAGADKFMTQMSYGIDTVIENGEEDGVNLSGGQAQKISIARALYKDAPFVILDEPTAALDPISEAEIYEKFNEMVDDKTSVYISHRMSSCRFCNEILVFDQGVISERGSHEELLARNGLYASLWNAQAKYYA